MTAPNLSQLALAAEEAAARGEKPAPEWNEVESFMWRYAHGLAYVNGFYADDETCIPELKDRAGYYARWKPMEKAVNAVPFKSKEAAMLFAESLLRLATAPLHREPAWREKAVEFAAKVLDGCESWEYGHGQNDLWARSHAAGLTYFDSEKDQVQLTPAGAALLAATADAKREEKPDA